MTDDPPPRAGEESPDPRLHPEQSPGIDDAGDITVDREDVTIGEATDRELTAADTEPVADADRDRLLTMLRADDPVVRRRAALALRERPATAATTEALKTAVRTDPDGDVRQFAVEALADLGADAEPVFREALTDANPWVRAEAVVALDNCAYPSARDRIVAALDDDHHAVRRNAAVSLFKREGEASLDRLLALADDESDRVREWVAHMLGGIDDPRAEETLATLADDEVDVVARTATAAIEADPETFRDRFCADDVSTPTHGSDSTFDEPPQL